MENDENLNRWVSGRLASLDPEAGWRPDAAIGLGRLRCRQRAVRRRRWGLSMAVILALASSMFVIPGCQAATCKQHSDNLAERLWKSVFAASPAGVPDGVTKPK